MKFDLVFALIDLPELESCEYYRASAAMMLSSARQAFKHHDVRTVQITDHASKVTDGTDIRFAATQKADRDTLMQYRGHCTAEWALQADRPAIFCDVDLLWNNDGITELLKPINGQTLDINLFSRPLNPFQPYNGGLLTTQPGQALFWQTYRAMMKHLPNDIKGWWGDQIALGVMVGAPQPDQHGAVRFGSRIGIVPIDMVAPSPRTVPIKALLDTPAVHMKGAKRKGQMATYYAMLQQSWSARAAAE